ncbi:hypothetical protein [Polymorphospora rubra]|uniref:hypothetical protein n=1 Tax=Polymorphospora rubra TaxID=338584 RepID=UPI003404235E
MPPLSTVPRHPARPGAAATGQVLALLLVTLVVLPLLPVILLVVAWIRLRDRFGAGAEPAVRPVSAPPSAAHAA